MPKETPFTTWCRANAPPAIVHCMIVCRDGGGSFNRSVIVPLFIKDVPIKFNLPIPDYIVRDDGSGLNSAEELSKWITVVSDHIYDLWDHSKEGMKFRILNSLAEFGVLHPRQARDLRRCMKHNEEKCLFYFDPGEDIEKRLSLAKYEGWMLERI